MASCVMAPLSNALIRQSIASPALVKVLCAPMVMTDKEGIRPVLVSQGR